MYANNLVAFDKKTELTVSTIEIANISKKRHDNVMRVANRLKKKNLITSPQIEEMFTVGNGAKNVRKIYMLNKTESLNLVANLSPEFTSKMIKRWVEMEESLSPSEYLLKQAQFMVVQERELKLMKQEQSVIKDRLEELNPDTGYCSVRGYCIRHEIKLSGSEAMKKGKKAGKLCKERGIEVGTVPDERYGRVNSYPVELLDEIFS